MKCFSFWTHWIPGKAVDVGDGVVGVCAVPGQVLVVAVVAEVPLPQPQVDGVDLENKSW